MMIHLNPTPYPTTPLCAVLQVDLTRGMVALISPEDSDLLALKWHAGNTGTHFYARRTWRKDAKKFYASLHRVVMERILKRPLVEGELVDHVDRNTLNNTRSNLRIANDSQNVCNRGLTIRNKSGFVGVHFSTAANKWVAQITFPVRHTNHLGCFKSKEDAARAYNEAALKFHGEFAVLNDITDAREMI